MSIAAHQQNMTVQYCFPENNLSCTNEVQIGIGNIFVFILLSCISVCTVFLNLLVIISISHFKQLHTPTNLLILSLAVADFLVGLIVMPLNTMGLIDNCWYLGETICTVVLVLNYLPLSASLCSMLCIAVDRYLAVNNPLIYPIKITVFKTSVFILFGWSFCLFYICIFLYFNDHLFPSQIMTRCHGECVLYIKYASMVVDLMVMFVTPCSILLILYSVIINVARRQAKALRSVLNSTSKRQEIKVSSNSETKAAKTLGIVVFVYVACWIPVYLSQFTLSVHGQRVSTLSLLWTVLGWIAYLNSSMNPIIYAIFYPWFRVSVKYVVTCRTLESSSSRFNLFQEHF